MYKKLFYIMLVSFFLITPLYAQEEPEEVEKSAYTIPSDSHEKIEEIKTPYIESFNSKFAVRLSAYKSSLDFDQTYNTAKKSYNSNSPLEIGLGFLYGNFGLEFRKQTSVFFDRNYPKTETQEIRLNYYSKSTVFEFQKKDYKGFHTGSKEETDLTLKCLGIFGQYIWNNKKYSWRAAFDLYDRQYSSAGSFLLGGNVFQVNPKMELPESYKKKYTLVTPNAGYAYTWVYKGHLFFALSLSLGCGIVHESSNSKNYLAVSHSFHGAAGYHWGDISFMISYQTFVFDTALDDKVEDSFDSSLLQCSVAKRF